MGGQVAEVAKLLGTPLMPWQRLVADVALELDEDGLPAYREVWFSTPRQSGKTSLSLPWEVHRCVAPVWGDQQRVIYTAQDGGSAFKKLMNDQVPLISKSPLGKLITREGGGRVRLARDDPGVSFGTGSRIDLLSKAASAGHGMTVDLGVLDEAWDDEDDRREQALIPAMATRPSAQLLGYSTMGDETSTYLNRKVAAGRQAALDDKGYGLAYFEWSIPLEADVDDEQVWLEYMPALCPDRVCRCGDGWRHTITLPVIRHARQTMSDGEFRRGFANQVATSDERVIPAQLWDQVQSPSARPDGELTFAVDVNVDQSSAAVAVSDGTVVAVVEHRPGVSWLVDWFGERSARRARPVVVDAGGPVSSVLDDLAAAGVRFDRRSGPEVAAACGRFFNAVADGQVQVPPSSQALDDAVAGVASKPVGEKFVWSRRVSQSDVTPLMAVTLAFARPSGQAAQVHEWPAEMLEGR